MRSSESPLPARLLYLITDELSSTLLRGQLGHLTDSGFDVVVGCRTSAAASHAVWDAGVRVEHIPFVRRPAPFADVRALVASVRLIRRTRPTIVHASTPKAGLLGSIAAWACRVPVRVYLVRGLRFETMSGVSRRAMKWAERVSCQCATQVVFTSQSLLRLARKEGLSVREAQVVGHGSSNGVDTRRFGMDTLPSTDEARTALGVPCDAKVMGFVGRVTRDKGVADIARVFTEALADRKDLHLLVVGDIEPGEQDVGSTIASLGTDPRVTLVPWLQDLRAAYAAMDILVFPSYREGLPNVPLEAQAASIPVVGYAATGTVDAVRDGQTGLLVPVGDHAALAEAIRDLLDDPDRRTRMGTAGAEWVGSAFNQQGVWTALAERYATWSAAVLEPPTPESASERAKRLRPTRALILINTDARRGSEIQGSQLAEQLRAAGLDVDLQALTPARHPGARLDVESLTPRFGVGTMLLVRRRARSYDVVLAYGARTLPACAIGLMGSRTPWVFRSIGDTSQWIRGRAHNARTGVLLRRADRIACLWQGDAAMLVERFGVDAERITVIPNARSGDHFRPPTDDERVVARHSFGIGNRRLVLYVGSLSEEKRVDLVIRACALIRNTTLVVVGVGPLQKTLKAMGRGHNNAEVRFEGSTEDVRPYYWAADVLALASRTEGMPGVVIEAAMCGVPVVATDVGAVGSMFELGVRGRLVAAEVPDSELARAISEAAESPRSSIDDVRLAFDWGSVTQRWDQLLTATRSRA